MKQKYKIMSEDEVRKYPDMGHYYATPKYPFLKHMLGYCDMEFEHNFNAFDDQEDLGQSIYLIEGAFGIKYGIPLEWCKCLGPAE